MAGELYISCNKTTEPDGLLRMNIVNRECNPYPDCNNKDESFESLLKRLISVDDDGTYLLNVCGCELIERTKLCETNSILVDDDTETEIYRMTVPAGALTSTGFISGMCKGLFYNNAFGGGDTPTIRIYYGNTLVVESISIEIGNQLTETYLPFEFIFTVYNLNEITDSQLVTGTYQVADGTAGIVGYPNMQSGTNNTRQTSFLGSSSEVDSIANDIVITLQFPAEVMPDIYCISHFREIEY